MQPTFEKQAEEQKTHENELITRLETVAERSREVYDGAIVDFRNSFTLGPTKFDVEEDVS